jgi:glycosyltransferase involved in cell wall biosynthesis
VSTAAATPRVGIDVSAVPERPAGAGRYVIELVRALGVRTDLALELFARRDDRARWQTLLAGGPHVVRAVAPNGRVARVVYGEVALGRVAHWSRPPIDLFHGTHYTFPMGTDDPVTVTVHDLTLVEHPEWHERAKVRYFSRAIARAAERAAAIVVPAAREAERFVERYAPVGEVVVIPHGIDHERFTPVEPAIGADRSTLERLGVRGRFVATLGTVEPRKNHVTLVEAFGRLAERDREVTLVIAGQEGWGSSALDQAIAASPHAERIRRLGYVADADAAALLRSAACVAYASWAEGFGLPALEVLACGAPLVTSVGTVMADVAGDAAVLVPPGDPDALAEALVATVVDGAEVARRRAVGLAIAGEYTWDACAGSHAALWLRTLGRATATS